jgi:lysophospholipase L1-like esterase
MKPGAGRPAPEANAQAPDLSRLSRGRKALYLLLPPLLVLAALEVGARIIYYQRNHIQPLAVVAAYHSIKQRVDLLVSQKAAKEKVRRLPAGANTYLFEAEGAGLLAQFQRQYEEQFARLAAEAHDLGCRLAVVYIPADFTGQSQKYRICRAFYQNLAARHEADFLDLTDALSRYPEEQVTLIPQNGHLSRLGNQLLAQAVGEYVKQQAGHRSRASFAQRPELLGDLSPGAKSLWLFNPELPYRVTVNAQGLRMNYDLVFPKSKPRILCLGDSFTFGPFMANFNTYPGLLQQKLPEFEVINAGICGYTISDEAALFTERAKYTEPDLIILQVVDNDLSDFFAHHRETFARERRAYAASPPEEEFLHRIKGKEVTPLQAHGQAGRPAGAGDAP